MQDKVLAFEAALAEVLSHASNIAPTSREIETVPLLESLGRVLATPLTADRDQPPFPRSTRDGYAMASGDEAWQTGSFHVIGSLRAGEVWTGPELAPGEAIEIMTGAPVPAGADAVLMVEHATLTGDTLHPHADRRLAPGENIVPQGAEVRASQTVLPAGRLLRAAEIAVAASVGATNLAVFGKPLVAIVATGDELVELDTQPLDWQIHNSNSYALASLVTGEGGRPARLKIACDTREDLFERIARGSMFDLLLLSGGVSMGKYDLVESILEEFGAEFFFTGALIQPGRPVVFGRIPKAEKSTPALSSPPESSQLHPVDGVERPAGKPAAIPYTYFFGLPGNPVSTQVCFHLFVAPMLRALEGQTNLAPQFVEAKLAEGVKGGARVTRFLPAELRGGWDGVTVRVVGWQGSGDVAANARGNCYAVLPAGMDAFHIGDTVRVLLR